MRWSVRIALVLLGAAFLGSVQAREIILEENMIYGSGGPEQLRLDLAIPAGNGPHPVIVCIHGGAWRSGNKSSYRARISDFARAGYAAAAVEYRLAPKYKFPAQVEDVKCAIRYLRANAVKLKIDADKIGVMGDSAGGHLALMLGLMNPKDGLEGEGGCSTHSSKVQAVVNYYGPTDLTLTDDWQEGQIVQASYFLGTTDPKSPIVAQASPAHYVNAGDAPVLTFHGTADTIVPVNQARHLHAALKISGVKEQLEIIDRAGHGWQGEDAARVHRMTLEFFNKCLK